MFMQLESASPSDLLQGKGVPDVNTRMFVRKLTRELKIPSLALVDADPHGEPYT